jgi:hypothetical protein
MGMSHLLYFRERASFIGRKGVPLARAATILTIFMMVGGGIFVLFQLAQIDWRAASVRHHFSGAIFSPSLLEGARIVCAPERICAFHQGSFACRSRAAAIVITAPSGAPSHFCIMREWLVAISAVRSNRPDR